MRSATILILLCILFSFVTVEGCSTDDDYCCTDNSQCGAVNGKQSYCRTGECGKCEIPDQQLQVSVTTWKDAVVGKPYEVGLTASGGFPPYDWVNFKRVNDTGNKLDWLGFEEEPSKTEHAYLRNDTANGQPGLPSTST